MTGDVKRYYAFDTLGNVGSRGETRFLPVEPANVGDAPSCSHCGRYLGMLRWLPPYRVELECWGDAFADLVFGVGDDLLVSERVRDVWQPMDFSGLSGFDPVTTERFRSHRNPSAEPPLYFRVDVARSRTAIDRVASGMSPSDDEDQCDKCRLAGTITGWERIVFESPLPSENIFMARGLPGHHFVDVKFRDFLNANSLISCPLVLVDQFQRGTQTTGHKSF